MYKKHRKHRREKKALVIFFISNWKSFFCCLLSLLAYWICICFLPSVLPHVSRLSFCLLPFLSFFFLPFGFSAIFRFCFFIYVPSVLFCLLSSLSFVFMHFVFLHYVVHPLRRLVIIMFLCFGVNWTKGQNSKLFKVIYR